MAIQFEAMPSYRELLQEVKSEIEEVDAERAHELLGEDERPVVLDVREREEWDQGHIPGALHIPRGSLESRVEQALPDRSRAVVVYCAAGNRSAFAAKTLEELGYESVASLAGGIADWQRHGLPTERPRAIDPSKRVRY